MLTEILVEALTNMDYDTLEHMIYVSCDIKRKVVEKDQKNIFFL